MFHDRFLPEEVIDAEDRVFRKHRTGDAVEFARRRQIRPKGFSTMTRAFSTNFAAPSPLITVSNSEGGIASNAPAALHDPALS